MSKPLLVHAFTVAESLHFASDVMKTALARGFDLAVISSPDKRLDDLGEELGIRTFPLTMPRRISPVEDARALASMTRLLARLRPDVVHAHTPKAGLLGTLAALACRVPVRFYHMRGLLAVTQRGAMRQLTLNVERVTCAAATRVLCHSPSLREVAVKEHLVSRAKSHVVLGGSNGVDAERRFNPERLRPRRAELRAAWDLPADARVIGFIGRIVKDKGVPELLRAFAEIARQHEDVHLLMAGPVEERDAIDPASHALLTSHPRIRAVGWVDPTIAYAVSDVLAFPSHREGFPNAPLEAAAMELPVVATRILGNVDAVVDGVTATLVPVADEGALRAGLERYLSDPALRAAHGRAGRLRVEKEFRRDRIADAVVDLYEADLRAHRGA